MEYRKFGDTYILRADRGEELVSVLHRFAELEQVRLASVQGLGATNRFTVGVFDPEEKRFIGTEYTGNHEIVSLVGTLDTMDGAYYSHLHMSAAAEGTNVVVGGHLIEAWLSLTAELVIRPLPGEIDRSLNPDTGINLMVL